MGAIYLNTVCSMVINITGETKSRWGLSRRDFRVVREDFPSKGTLEWSFSGGERTGRVAIWGKAFQAEGTSKECG